MDQLIIQWLAGREAGRHNTTVETETERHNRATEGEARRHNVATEVHNTFATMAQVAAQRDSARIHADATRYASDNSRRAAEYSANTSAAASRYHTMTNAWTSMQHEATSRQANAIQDRFNTGKLAIAAAEYQEQKRANLEREKENRLSRQSSHWLKEKELEYKHETLEYQKSQDWLNRVKSEREFETNTRLKMSEQIIDLLSVGAKARMFQSLGGKSNGQQQTQQTILTSGRQEESPQDFWKRLNDGFDKELAR